MPKINREEYEILKGLDDRWKWIARDESGELYTHEEKPEKAAVEWANGRDYYLYLGNETFQFIQWEDEEPHKIAELIREYEFEKILLAMAEEETVLEIVPESEETEVKKDIEWLKETLEERIDTMAKFEDVSYSIGLKEAYQHTLLLINQLDEPEVLSQEWIDKYKVDYDNWMPAVPIVHLQNLLVPKQELPVIPNYVAKWISEHHERFDLYPALRRLEEGSTRDYDAYKWYRANTLKFVVAYLTGVYEVEEEQKYYAKIKGWELFVEFVGAQYWGEVSNYGRLGFVNIDGAKDRTKDEWEKLGINDTNADFVLAEELEE